MMSTALETAEAKVGRALATSKCSFQIAMLIYLLDWTCLVSYSPILILSGGAHSVGGMGNDRFASL
jgi:hypothetical protein